MGKPSPSPARPAGCSRATPTAPRAAAHLGLDRYDRAHGHAQQAIALYRRTGYRLGQAPALVEMGHALEHTDGKHTAQPCWHEALMLFAEIGSPEADQVHALLSAASRTAAGDSELEGS